MIFHPRWKQVSQVVRKRIMHLGVKGFDVSTMSGFTYVINSKLSSALRTSDNNDSWRGLRPLLKMQISIIFYFAYHLELVIMKLTVTILQQSLQREKC